MPLPIVTAYGAANAFLGSSLGSTLVGAAGDLFSASQARKRAKEERDWQERMSNTSYQRAVKDLQAAGLNPMLAYTQGGASTPNTSAAPTPDFGKSGDRLREGLASSSARQVMAAQLKSITAAAGASEGAELAAREQARKTGLEADILEPVAANSARSAAANITTLEAQAKRAIEDALKSVADRKQSEVTLEQLQPLTIAYQRWMTEQARLGIPEKEADAKFWDTSGAWGKGLNWLKQLIRR